MLLRPLYLEALPYYHFCKTAVQIVLISPPLLLLATSTAPYAFSFYSAPFVLITTHHHNDGNSEFKATSSVSLEGILSFWYLIFHHENVQGLPIHIPFVFQMYSPIISASYNFCALFTPLLLCKSLQVQILESCPSILL